MKKKLLIYFIILILTSTMFTGIFIIQSAKMLYKSETDQKLISIATLIGSDIENLSSVNKSVDYNSIAKQYSSNLSIMNSFSKDILVMILDTNGNVKGESKYDTSNIEYYNQRNEIISLLKNDSNNIDIRNQKYISKESITVSVPITSQNLIVQISTPSTILNDFHSAINYDFLVGLSISLLISIFLAIKFSYDLSEPIESLARFSGKVKRASLLNDENMTSTSDNIKGDGLDTLVGNFYDISEALHKTISILENKNATLNSILNGMSAGVIVLDNSSKVVLLNNVAKNILELAPTKDYINQNIIEIIRNPTVNNMIIKGITDKTKISDNITLHYVQDKIISVVVIPVKLSDKANLGVMIYMEDVSEMRKLEQIRTEFVSNVTHELKTPLTSIKGFVETLKQGAIEDPEVSKKFLDIIDIEAERLYMLIEDVLELSEIESNHNAAEMQFESCGIADVVGEVIDVVSDSAVKKSIVIHTDIEEGLKVKADKHRVKQLFLNLVDNAIKYTDNNGEIFIDAFSKNDKAVIKVRDTGIGISEEHLPRIFERFYRVDKSRTRNTGGTGLGLSIVKHIVQLYNGDLSVKSELSKGTEFTITL